MKLLQYFKAWRERRYWQRRHVDFVRRMVNDDWRWLAANPIADALTTRYRAALSPDWFKHQHQQVSDFRERLRALPNLTDEQKLRNVRNALYIEQLRESLQALLDLCATGDVDENTEVHGWGDAIKRAKALIEADAAIPDGVQEVDRG